MTQTFLWWLHRLRLQQVSKYDVEILHVMYDNLCWIILKVFNLISLKCLLNIEKLLHWDFTEQCVIKELWRHSFTWLIEFDSEWNSNDVEMAFSLNLHISLRNDVEVVWLWFLFKNDCYIYHAIQIMYTTQRNATNCTSNEIYFGWSEPALPASTFCVGL